MAYRLCDVVGLPGTDRLNNNGCLTTCAGVESTSVAEIYPVDPNLTAIGNQPAAQQFLQGRLPGAVASHHRNQFPLLDVKAGGKEASVFFIGD